MSIAPVPTEDSTFSISLEDTRVIPDKEIYLKGRLSFAGKHFCYFETVDRYYGRVKCYLSRSNGSGRKVKGFKDGRPVFSGKSVHHDLPILEGRECWIKVNLQKKVKGKNSPPASRWGLDLTQEENKHNNFLFASSDKKLAKARTKRRKEKRKDRYKMRSEIKKFIRR